MPNSPDSDANETDTDIRRVCSILERVAKLLQALEDLLLDLLGEDARIAPGTIQETGDSLHVGLGDLEEM